jgi:hypothetical protein
MSILSWLKEVTTGDTKAGFIDTDAMTYAKGEEQFHGLDMKAALDAHMAWTQRLEGKLSGENQENLEVASVASDCECMLGKWLHGDARQQFGESGDYQELRQVHADFHLKAGEILNNVLNGDREQALKNLRELRYQSGNVQLSLVRLYSHAQH